MCSAEKSLGLDLSLILMMHRLWRVMNLIHETEFHYFVKLAGNSKALYLAWVDIPPMKIATQAWVYSHKL